MKKQCTICHKEREMMTWDKECYSCRKERDLARIRGRILNGESDHTYCEDEIICPYCGEVVSIEECYELYEEGEHELQCPECEKEFVVETDISYSYSTSRQDEDDEEAST